MGVLRFSVAITFCLGRVSGCFRWSLWPKDLRAYHNSHCSKSPRFRYSCICHLCSVAGSGSKGRWMDLLLSEVQMWGCQRSSCQLCNRMVPCRAALVLDSLEFHRRSSCSRWLNECSIRSRIAWCAKMNCRPLECSQAWCRDGSRFFAGRTKELRWSTVQSCERLPHWRTHFASAFGTGFLLGWIP